MEGGEDNATPTSRGQQERGLYNESDESIRRAARMLQIATAVCVVAAVVLLVVVILVLTLGGGDDEQQNHDTIIIVYVDKKDEQTMAPTQNASSSMNSSNDEQSLLDIPLPVAPNASISFVGSTGTVPPPPSPPPPQFVPQDPFQGLKPADVLRWRQSGDGLALTVVNALQPSSDWIAILDKVVSDWNSGDPDAVSLTIEPGTDTDGSCNPAMDQIKVCNGDYGNTEWYGITLVIISSGWMVAAAVKLNDYYFLQSGGGATNQVYMQYQLCHEIGHALGLAHTDDDFFNEPLGDCMDFSSHDSAEVNLHPGNVTFGHLRDIYGALPSG